LIFRWTILWLDDVVVDECSDEVILDVDMLGLVMEYWILGHFCF
jgi:hypothetical protein